jgi:hypothetical protein
MSRTGIPQVSVARDQARRNFTALPLSYPMIRFSSRSHCSMATRPDRPVRVNRFDAQFAPGNVLLRARVSAPGGWSDTEATHLRAEWWDGSQHSRSPARPKRQPRALGGSFTGCVTCMPERNPRLPSLCSSHNWCRSYEPLSGGLGLCKCVVLPGLPALGSPRSRTHSAKSDGGDVPKHGAARRASHVCCHDQLWAGRVTGRKAPWANSLPST